MMHTLLDFSPVSFTPSASAPPLLRSASSDVASLQPNQQLPASSLAAVLLHATGSVDGEQPGVQHVEARSTLARNLLRQGSVTSPPLVVSPSSAPQQGHHPVAGLPKALPHLSAVKQSVLSRTTTLEEVSGRCLHRQACAVVDLVRDEALLLSFVEVRMGWAV